MTTKAESLDRFGWWPCACVKRGAGKRLTHIKLNAPNVKKCRVCGALKPTEDQPR